nr:glutaredoxin-like protein NrdH [Leucobacter sp. wl10]
MEVVAEGCAAPAEAVEVVVYSKPSCMQCQMTYRALDGKGVPYRVVDLTEDTEALAYVTEELGYAAAPVVVVGGRDHWAGFRPDEIDRAAAGLLEQGVLAEEVRS